jgi:hypothetical protein
MRLLICIISCLCFNLTNAQSTKLIKQIDIGGIRGIQLSKTFPILKIGGTAQLTISKEFGKYIQAGAGVGFIQLDREDFVPVYLYVKGIKKEKENSFFFETAVGYSKGNNYDFNSSLSSRFSAGVYFSPGFGYQYIVNENWAVSSSISYVLQKAKLDQINENQEIYYTEPLSIDLIVFKIGVIIR